VAGCGHLCFPSEPVTGADASRDASMIDGGPSVGWLQSPGLINNTDVGNATSATFAKPVTPGNAIVAFAWTYGPGGQSYFNNTSVTDSAGDGYVVAAYVATAPTACNGTSASSALGIFVATGIQSASPVTVTVTAGGPATQEVELYIAEYTGVTAVDQSKIQDLLASPSPTIVDTGPTSLTAVADELVVAAASTCAGSPGTVAWADNTGLTLRAQETMTTVTQPGIVGDKLVTNVGLFSASWTLMYNGAQRPSLSAIVTLR
jgi:hypothetical protein